MSDWQTAKKACHGVCFGINLENYGANQSDLNRLNRIGIVKYVQEGGKLPSDEHIQAIQGALKSFCEDASKSIKTEGVLLEVNLLLLILMKTLGRLSFLSQMTAI